MGKFPSQKDNVRAQIVDDIGALTHDPSGFVRYAYPWAEKQLADSAGPRAWQLAINDYIAAWFADPVTRHQPCRIAVASGHGVGKSAEIAMVIDWAMSTCEDCKVVVTAGTGTQLATKTVPEVSKWTRLAINQEWWDINATSIRFRHKAHQATWRADFITWSEHNTEPFAGLHNQGKRIVLIFDEASAIADKVWEVAEGAMTDENTEIIWLAFGNPTQNTGRFKECFGKFKHRWKTFQIDSRTVEGTNKSQLQKWVDDYGEDSDFVRVRVKGEFPRAGSTQLIPSDVVAMCRKYKADGFQALPKILSVDVARFGDDQTVVGLRQGRKFQVMAKYRGLDTVQVAQRVIQFMEEIGPDATVIDGDGIGGGVIDQLRSRGFSQRLFEFHGGQAADDAAMYFNKRAEAWGTMADQLRQGFELPDDPEIEQDLTGPMYGFSNKNQIQLEKKADMKSRGLSSPDIGDCLAMSFSVKVALPKPAPKPVFAYPGQLQQSWMG